MNLAFYVDKTDNNDFNVAMFNMLNEATTKYKSGDFSVFYNDMDYNPVQTRFGMFNATELWAFTGTLVSTSTVNTVKALNVVNKFKLIHMYNDKENNSLFDLITLLSDERVTIMTKDNKDTKKIHRLTGKTPKQINSFCVEEILEVI